MQNLLNCLRRFKAAPLVFFRRGLFELQSEVAGGGGKGGDGWPQTGHPLTGKDRQEALSMAHKGTRDVAL